MNDGNETGKKMKLVGWVSDAVKGLGSWAHGQTKASFAHDANEFERIIDEIGVAPTTTVEEMEEWLGNFDKKLAEMKHSPTVRVPTQKIFTTFVKPMFDHLELEPHSEPSPELAKTIGIAAGSIGLGLAAYAAGMVVETISLGQIDGFDKFWNQVVSATGVYRISRLLTSLPLELAVFRPMGYEYNTYYRTFKPRLNDTVRWYGRGHIGDNGFKEFMGWHGVEDRWFPVYKRFAARETSYFMLNAIAREGFFDKEKFRFWLSDAGYGAFPITDEMRTEYEIANNLIAPNETQIDFLLDNYERMANAAEFSGIQTLAKKAFKRGDIDEATFRAYLKQAGKPDTIIDLIVQNTKAEAVTEERDLTITVMSKLYRIGRMTEEAFRAELKELKYSDESIDDLIYLENLKKQEDPQTLTRSQVETYFKEGTIEEDEFRARLKNMNYSDRDIELMVKHNKLKIGG